MRKSMLSFKPMRKSKTTGKKEELLYQRMKKIWSAQDYHEFLNLFEEWLSSTTTYWWGMQGEEKERIIKKFCIALDPLSKLWYSNDPKIHDKIKGIYLYPVMANELKRRQAISCNKYLRTILCTKVMEFANNRILECLRFSKFLLKPEFIEKQTLKVESNLTWYYNCKTATESQSPAADGNCKYDLERISVEFMENLYIYPLKYYDEYPNDPGVYFIYYIGQTPISDGLVMPSTAKPIYVGMSTTNISQRLKDHHGKINQAPDLKVDDFIVRFMTVDIKHFAPGIERMLIEHFCPTWNGREGFSFGNAKDRGSKWNKCHAQKESYTKRPVEDYFSTP